MTTTGSTTKNADPAKDRDKELERTIRNALVLAVGKRAANQAFRHTRQPIVPAWLRADLPLASGGTLDLVHYDLTPPAGTIPCSWSTDTTTGLGLW